MSTESLTALTKAMSENELLTAVTDALTLYGFRWFHIRRSDLARQMGHSGFPDICAAKNGKVVFLELKTQKGELSADQQAWIKALRPSNWAVVRPSDLNWFLSDLQAGRL